jgi:hypothetical protein
VSGAAGATRWKRTVWYSVHDEDGERFELELAVAIDLGNPVDRGIAASGCAEDYNNEHDGWESSWPVNLWMFASEEGPAIDRFVVEKEVEPVFRPIRPRAERVAG